MKAKFTTLDIKLLVAELEEKLLGMRVNNVYDIDTKTYLIKLNRTDAKAMLLLESGIRFHTTEFEWPKNIIPSGFAMKLRKHLKGRRLESIKQLGMDRIVDMQFGSGEAAYHVILEVYDRGNIVLTDFEYTILNIQRPRADNDQDVKFIVREKYPIHLAKVHESVPSRESILQIFENAKKGETIKKILNPHLVYGSHLLDHCLLERGLQGSAKFGTVFQIERDLEKLMEALNSAEEFMNQCTEKSRQGYIINEKVKKAVPEENQECLTIYSEFHPFLFRQYAGESYTEFESFDKAVDEFFSKIESQKQDRKLLQQKTTAMKKLEHIKFDNQNRIEGLREEQLIDLKKAWLIELNQDLVEEVILLMRNALAHQMDWTELKKTIEEVGTTNDVISSIKFLKLDINHITMLLKPPMDATDDNELCLKPMKVDIDLGMSAYANARRYYDQKRHAAMKEMKTSDALHKAYKSAEKKTIKVLKEVQTIATINKARKTHWFEKFLWFISSENYIVIGGRDQQQNELIVKKYMKPGDIYVHADLHGASSVVIKNPTKNPIPPVTLNEAGTMALCNSAAWDARVVTSSWWVYHDQVSKTAPTGEYLTTGSFMIRGKKNYLLPSSLIYGFGFLFKLDETCMERHRNERRIKGINDEDGVSHSADNLQEQDEEVIPENGDGDDDDDDASNEEGVRDASTSEGKVDDNLGSEGDDNDDDGDDNVKDAPASQDDGNGDFESEVGKSDVLTECKDVEIKQEEEESNFDAFPDTQIKVDHFLSPDSVSTESMQKDNENNLRMSAKQRRNLRKQDSIKNGTQDTNIPEKNVASNGIKKSQNLKRGQKSKLKKIKEKYGDQDDEERELRIQLLAANKEPKEMKKKKKDSGKSSKDQKNSKNKQDVNRAASREVIKSNHDEIVIDPNQIEQIGMEEELDEEADNKQIQQEMELLDSLTGQPYEGDVLHYCIPVCAPWTALINYRFKVKLTPGTTKRGKAAKMSIGMFMQDKSTTALERDLFRSIKDTDLSRNMPGKVKVSVTKTHNKK